MCEWLTKLGVGNDIRSLFQISGPSFFDYGDSQEVFEQGSLKVPATRNIWRGGNELAPTVVITPSVGEAISFLICCRDHFISLDAIHILSLGCRVSTGQTCWIRDHLKRRKFVLVFPDDPAGRAGDIFIAAGIRNIGVKLTWAETGVLFDCKNKEFFLPTQELSLAAFERAAGIRTGIRTIKPLFCNTFLEQLYELR